MPSGLEHFDLVSVRVLDEEKTCQQGIVFFEFFDRRRRITQCTELAVHGVKIIGSKRIMAIAVAMRVGLSATEIMGQFDFEIILWIFYVDQRKIIEVKSMRPDVATVWSRKGYSLKSPKGKR